MSTLRVRLNSKHGHMVDVVCPPEWVKIIERQDPVPFTYKEALEFGQALINVAMKAERKENVLLPTKKEVDQFEENVCGIPTLTHTDPEKILHGQSLPMSAGEMARGKKYGFQ